MAGPLLETKLHVPRRRDGRVVRSRLNDRLALGAQTALTLVSAPAGFGKTTLLAEWIGRADGKSLASAWLSLDSRDGDPALFWAYLIAALRTAEPSLGSIALSLLDSPGTPIEDVLASLLNDLDDVAGDLVLVLDDYHVIESPRDPGRDGVPARAPAGPAASGDRRPRGPGAPAGTAARPRRARRDPR